MNGSSLKGLKKGADEKLNRSTRLDYKEKSKY